MRHNFLLGKIVDDEPFDPQWFRVHAECVQCHEKRLVYHAVPMSMLNAEECMPEPETKPKISRKFFGLF